MGRAADGTDTDVLQFSSSAGYTEHLLATYIDHVADFQVIIRSSFSRKQLGQDNL